MKKFFFPAPEVAAIGRELIEQYHPHLLEHEVRVEFVFRTDTPTKNGKQIWGTARKISSLSSFLRRENETQWNPGPSDDEIEAIADEDARDCARIEKFLAEEKARSQGNAPFFVITISKKIWDKLGEMHRRALVDHELMHCGADYDRQYNTKLSTTPHDFEGFREEIERWGLWRPAAAEIAGAFKNAQLTLELEDENAPEKEAQEESS